MIKVPGPHPDSMPGAAMPQLATAVHTRCVCDGCAHDARACDAIAYNGSLWRCVFDK